MLTSSRYSYLSDTAAKAAFSYTAFTSAYASRTRYYFDSRFSFYSCWLFQIPRIDILSPSVTIIWASAHMSLFRSAFWAGHLQNLSTPPTNNPEMALSVYFYYIGIWRVIAIWTMRALYLRFHPLLFVLLFHWHYPPSFSVRVVPFPDYHPPLVESISSIRQ